MAWYKCGLCGPRLINGRLNDTPQLLRKVEDGELITNYLGVKKMIKKTSASGEKWAGFSADALVGL